MEKINVAELLKDCPKGMELDCTMFDGVYFDHVDDLRLNRIKCYVNNGNEHFEIEFEETGQYISNDSAKCVIFPKGKTTWEGFQRPFKDGDVVTSVFQGAVQGTGIFDYEEQSEAWIHVCINLNDDFFTDGYLGHVYDLRFATEEEKQKLFQAIKDNGYRWNAETKTLEKLIEPKFKVGDRITLKNCDDGNVYKIIYVKETYYVTDQGKLPFYYADSWELVLNKFDINTLVPFESKVLIRDNNDEKWSPAIWGYYDANTRYPYKVIGCLSRCCIPYEGNEHLLGTTDDCDEYFKTWE